MRKITFKNGKSLEVSKEIVDNLFNINRKRNDNALNTFETFTDEAGNIICVINLSEISYVE